MHSLTGQWDIVQFIGLSVYLSMRSLTGQWDSAWFIGLFGLSVYFSLDSGTVSSLLGLSVNALSHWIVG